MTDAPDSPSLLESISAQAYATVSTPVNTASAAEAVEGAGGIEEHYETGVAYRARRHSDGSIYHYVDNDQFSDGTFDDVADDGFVEGLRTITQTSQNGWTANNRGLCGKHTVPGSSRYFVIRNGDVAVIFMDFLAWFHANIEDLDNGIYDDWGYAERLVRGSTSSLSNHASGTAIDANATRHPLGRRGTFSTAQAAAIRARLAQYDGCLRWGGDYSGRPDEMHVEINRNAAACKIVANRIRAGAGQPVAPPVVVRPAPIPVKPAPGPVLPRRAPDRPAVCKRGANGKWVYHVQRCVGIGVDGSFGPATDRAVRAWQSRYGLVNDGSVGPATWRKMVMAKGQQARKSTDTAQVMLIQDIVRTAVDGDWGEATHLAVQEVQRYVGVRDDGYWGNGTTTAVIR